jgi:hypothetical protein
MAKCGGILNCIGVTYKRAIPLGPCRHCYKDGMKRHGLPPSYASWYMALYPDSYLLRQDHESYGIYWCFDKNCRNYYQLHGVNGAKIALQNSNCYADREEREKPVGFLSRMRSIFLKN